MIGLRVNDGVTVTDLNAGNHAITRYTPLSAPRTEFVIRESFVVDVSGVANGKALVTLLEQLFTLARRRAATGIGPRIYAEFRLLSGDSYWQSEILDGDTGMVEDQYHYDVLSGYVQVEVSWLRKNYWEATTETNVQISNAVSGAANQLTIYNMSNVAAARNNYVRIAAAQIPGDIETPVRLEIVNNYASTTRASDVCIGHLIERNGTLDGVIEIESGTYYGSSAEVVSAAHSNGKYVNVVWSGAGIKDIWTSPITTAFLNAASSARFRILAVTAAGASTVNARVRARIMIEGLHEQWVGPWVAVPYYNADILDLGQVQLPPGLLGATNSYPLGLQLQGWDLTAGSNTVPMDFICLMPADSWRFLGDSGFSFAQGVTLHDNGIDEYTYTEGWATPGRLKNFVPEGRPIMLAPNKGNALYFLHRPTTAARTLQIKVYIRPRRLTI